MPTKANQISTDKALSFIHELIITRKGVVEYEF